MKNDIGSIIKSLRNTAGMTQVKLAEKIGVGYQQVLKYESGQSKLTVERLQLIADIFQTSIWLRWQVK